MLRNMSSIGIPQFKEFILSARSLMYTANKLGEIRHPCFTPDSTLNHGVKRSFTLTAHLTSLYNDSSAHKNFPLTSARRNLNQSMFLDTESNALRISMKQTNVDFRAIVLSLITLYKVCICSSQLRFSRNPFYSSDKILFSSSQVFKRLFST